MDEQEEVRQGLRAWRDADDQADAAIRSLSADPEGGRPAFVDRLRSAALRPGAPPELAAVVTGGLVEKIVQIAQARDVNIILRSDSERRTDLQALLALRLTADAGLPAIRDVNPYDIGVSRSKYSKQTQPYVHRRVDGRLRDALLNDSFVLLVGLSKAGKSRTLFEALAATMPEARLLVPTGDPSAPAKLLACASAYTNLNERIVLWLDDIDRYLAPSGLDALTLDGFAGLPVPVLIAATMRSKRRDDVLAAAGETGRSAHLVLGRAQTITLPRTLQPDERDEATRLYADEDFTQRGIGEQLVAAPLLEQRYEDAYESNPAGWAVIQAAIDHHRVGLESPMTRSTLSRWFAPYLLGAAPELDPTDESFEAGLLWARQPVAGSIALLQAKHDEDGPRFSAFDYIRAYADGQRPESAVEIPDFSWELALREASPRSLLGIGFAAITRKADVSAHRAFAQALDSGEDDVIPVAALILGDLEAEAGHLDRGRTLLVRAIESDDQDIVPMAQLDLGALEIRNGEPDRARGLLEAALASGHPLVVPMAQANLGGLLVNAGEFDPARELLEKALVSDDKNAVPLAQANLGALHVSIGEPDRARDLLEAALSSGHPQVMPLAQANLAFVLVNIGAIDRARELLEAALTSGDPAAVPTAQANLGSLLLNAGDIDRARELLEAAAVRADKPRIASLAQANLGALLVGEGEVDRGRALLEAAVESADPQVVPVAQVNLGMLLAREGETERAFPLLEQAAASNDPTQRPRALGILGDLRAAQGDVAGAEVAFRAVIDTAHPVLTPIAQIDLAMLYRDHGRAAEAQALLETVGASDDLVQKGRALYFLGGLRARQGDLIGARASFRATIETGHTFWAPMAQVDLSGMEMADGRLDRALELLEAAVRSGDPQVVPRAQASLGGVLINAGDNNRARELLEAVIDSGDPTAMPLAQGNLGGLLFNAGDYDRARQLLEAALASGNPDVAPMAQANLGGLLYNAGELDGARELLEAALAAANPQTDPIVQMNLGSLLISTGEPDRGRELLEAAAASAYPRIAAMAQVSLARLLADSGEVDRARQLLEQAAASDTRDQKAEALALLGALLAASDEVPGAEAAYRAAIDAAHPEWTPIAQTNLAVLLLDHERTAEARRLLEQVGSSDDQDQKPRALDILGRLLNDEDDLAGAEAAFTAAAGTGHPLWTPIAQYQLAIVYLGTARFDEARPLLEQAAASDDLYLRTLAEGLLGDVLTHQGDAPAAEAAYRKAMDSDDDTVRTVARERLNAASDVWQDWFGGAVKVDHNEP